MAEGYKDWSAGDILTAADLEDYTVKQSVMRFADSSARTTALSGVLAEGMMSYLKDTDTVEVYDGSAWAAGGGGKILQVVSTTKTDTFSASITAGSSSAVTGLTVNIAPSSTSNKVLIQVMLSGAVSVSDRAGVILTRGGSAISGAIAGAAGSRARVTGGITDREFDPNTSTFVYLDSPASTSTLTYGVSLQSVATRTHYVNRGQDDTDSTDRFRAVSTITVMEVSA